MKAILFAFCVIPSAVCADATIIEGAGYLPDRMTSMLPELQKAIELVARSHPGCLSIDNASFSDTYGTPSSPAFFVTCTMADGSPEFQNVFVKDGRIIATLP